MPLRNACFISFRHGDQELTQRFISELHKGLLGELETQFGRDVGVFLDNARLRGGDLFNEAIAEHLCESTCLLIVYTPSYFDLKYSYCAREYKAMVELERQRLGMLGQGIDQTHGLIIPVVFRGENTMPPEIRKNRLCYDFADFLMVGRALNKHKKFAATLRDMAEYIAERHRTISALVPSNCAGFRLPNEVDIRAWLTSVIPGPPPLPGRSDDQ
jgi:hypothetical protein